MRRREFLSLSVGALLAGCSSSANKQADWLCWGTQGTRDGSFIRPRAVATDRGEVFVIDTTGRVQVFDEQGKFLRLWNLPAFDNGTPTGIRFEAEGGVLIPDTHYSRVLEYGRDGTLKTQWGSYGSGPDQFIYPTDMLRDSAGSYFFSEYGERAERVHVFDAKKQFLRQWGGPDGATGNAAGEFNRAMSLALSDAGVLHVADTANHRVQCFDTSGRLLRIIGGEDGAVELKYPHDLALAPDGTLLVAEYGAHRISRFREDGSFLAAYGNPGRGPGQLHGPRGVAVSDEGRVFVADTDNQRIQSFLLEGAV